ncbi:MAG: right-handed parallel beta-helix repeat-containing protein [Deltaproteobacteria bacterium]|nr:right-handed parallel beta-helix repeat-containing protein [Deltaproteobacteria bacterium]
MNHSVGGRSKNSASGIPVPRPSQFERRRVVTRVDLRHICVPMKTAQPLLTGESDARFLAIVDRVHAITFLLPAGRASRAPGARALCVVFAAALLAAVSPTLATANTPAQPSTAAARAFDVQSFGARCDGQADDTTAIDAAQRAAAAVGGGIVDFPAGKTCVVTRRHSGAAAVTIAGDHLTFRCNGATLRAASTAPPRTTEEEMFFASALRAVGRHDLVFENCNFDGRRSAAPDPRMSFLVGVQTSGVQIRGGHFHDITNDRGAILATSYDCRLDEAGACASSSSNLCLRDWTIEHNRFDRSVVGLWIEESFQDVRVVANTLSKMDLAPYVTAPDDYGYAIPDGYRLGGYTLLRAIRLSGFARAPSACEIRGVHVAGNEVEGPLAIEIWNSAAGRGRDVRRAHDIVVEGNTMHSLGGAWVNSASKVEIRGNTWRRLALDRDGIDAYRRGGGTVHDLRDTSGVFGAGIEARPLSDYRVTRNVLDGGYASGTSNEGGGFGIVIGAGWGKGDGVVADNTVANSYIGIKVNEVQGATVRGNRISGCYHAFESDFGQLPIDNPDADQSGNLFSGNTVESDEVAADTADGILFTASVRPTSEAWRIEGNRIRHKPDSANVTAAIYFANPLGSYEVVGNTVSGFRSYAVRDAALRTFYQGNVFDSLQEKLTGTVMPFRFDEQAGKSVTVKDTTVRRCNTVAAVSAPPGPDPPRQSYELGTVSHDGALKDRAIRISPQ